MDAHAFRSAREIYFKKRPFSDPDEYKKVWETMTKAAAPEHVGKNVGVHMSDKVICSCGWESFDYWDMEDAAWGDWREHVAEQIGLLPKECPCGKAYVPADGGKPCHKLLPTN